MRRKTYTRIVNPSLAELDPTLPAEIAERSPLARAWRAFERALTARIADTQARAPRNKGLCYPPTMEEIVASCAPRATGPTGCGSAALSWSCGAPGFGSAKTRADGERSGPAAVQCWSVEGVVGVVGSDEPLGESRAVAPDPVQRFRLAPWLPG